MKHLLSVALIIATAVTAFSTGQTTEKINDNGISKGMTACLLETDSISFSKLKERIPKKMVSTALWRGYLGHWKIKNDSLFLDSILIRDITCDTARFIPAMIDDIYAAHRTPSGYFADWVTDTVRIVSGNLVYYRHMGWQSYWENEEFVSVKDGLIKDRTVYKNQVINPVNKDGAWLKRAIDSLDLGFIPKTILLQVGCQNFDEKGNPTEYNVKVVRSCGDTIIDNRAVRAMKNSTIIRRLVPVYYVRGQYMSQDWDIPIHRNCNPRTISN